MDTARQFFNAVREGIEVNPLASNVCLGFILLCFEKIVELEFVCPCSKLQNIISALSFLIAPALLVFVLMLNIRSLLKSCRARLETILHSLVPGVTWVVILLIDGRYYACFKTSWGGKYEDSELGPPVKWCKPTDPLNQELFETHEWYIQSQVTGLWIAFGLGALYKLILLNASCCCQSREESQNENTHERVNLEMQNNG